MKKEIERMIFNRDSTMVYEREAETGKIKEENGIRKRKIIKHGENGEKAGLEGKVEAALGKLTSVKEAKNNYIEDQVKDWDDLPSIIEMRNLGYSTSDIDGKSEYIREVGNFDAQIAFHENCLKTALEEAINNLVRINDAISPYRTCSEAYAGVQLGELDENGELVKDEKGKPKREGILTGRRDELRRRLEQLKAQRDAYPEYNKTYTEEGKAEFARIGRDIASIESEIDSVSEEIEMYQAETRREMERIYRENIRKIQEFEKIASEHGISIETEGQPKKQQQPPAAVVESAAPAPEGEKGQPAATAPEGEKGQPAATAPKGEKGQPAATAPKGEKGQPAAENQNQKSPISKMEISISAKGTKTDIFYRGKGILFGGDLAKNCKQNLMGANGKVLAERDEDGRIALRDILKNNSLAYPAKDIRPLCIQAMKHGDKFVVNELILAEREGRINKDELKEQLQTYESLMTGKLKPEDPKNTIVLSYDLRKIGKKKVGLNKDERTDLIAQAKKAKDLGLVKDVPAPFWVKAKWMLEDWRNKKNQGRLTAGKEETTGQPAIDKNEVFRREKAQGVDVKEQGQAQVGDAKEQGQAQGEGAKGKNGNEGSTVTQAQATSTSIPGQER